MGGNGQPLAFGLGQRGIGADDGNCRVGPLARRLAGLLQEGPEAAARWELRCKAIQQEVCGS